HGEQPLFPDCRAQVQLTSTQIELVDVGILEDLIVAGLGEHCIHAFANRAGRVSEATTTLSCYGAFNVTAEVVATITRGRQSSGDLNATGGPGIVVFPDGIRAFQASIHRDRAFIKSSQVEVQHNLQKYRFLAPVSSWSNLNCSSGRRKTNYAPVSSASAKKNLDSRSAFSSESEAWIAFRSFDSAYSFRTVPSAASAGSVAPITVRSVATASSRSRTTGMQRPDVMNETSEP